MADARIGQSPHFCANSLTWMDNVPMSAPPKTSAPEIARRVIRIQVLTLVWMSMEAAVSLGAAALALLPLIVREGWEVMKGKPCYDAS